MPADPAALRSWGPALILAADHRGRGVITIERYADYLDALAAALPASDGILATAQPLADLVERGAVTDEHRTYLSINRSGLAGAPWELDDRLVASVERAAADGYTGVKLMTRIDLSDPRTSDALELLGRVLEAARPAGLEALIESVTWRDGQMSNITDDIVYAAVVAHDLGAPLLKVPVPSAAPGAARVEQVARVVASVGVPVLFLGGPRRDEPAADDAVVAEAVDVMAGGGAGLAIGRAVLFAPDPKALATRLAAAIHAD
jgi:DhnA family fructose-bisphosphate aldolase class Ia